MSETNIKILSASTQIRGDIERFDLFNIPQGDHTVNGYKQSYQDTLNVIKETNPILVTIKSRGLASETIGDFIYDLYERYYYLLKPERETFENSIGDMQRTINIVFQLRPDAERRRKESENLNET